MAVASFDELLPHVGHDIVCVTYGNPPVNVAVECETCSEVLVDFDDREQMDRAYDSLIEDVRSAELAMYEAVGGDESGGKNDG